MLDAIYSSLSGQMNAVWSGYGAVAGLVSGPAQIALAINLILVGYGIMRGVVSEPWGAYLASWFRAYLAVMFATSTFGAWAGSVAWTLPDQLVGALGGGPIAGQFDSFIQTISNAAFMLAEAAPKWIIDFGITTVEWPDLVAYALAYLVLIIAYLVAAVAMTMILFAKFGLAVTIAVGPIFAAGLIFNSSSGMFFSWLGAVLSYAINVTAIALVFVFVTGTIWSIATSVQSGGASWAAIYGALILQGVMTIIGGVLLMNAGSIANFAGGGGSSGGGLISAVIPSSRTTMAAGRFASRIVRGGGGGKSGVGGGAASGRGSSGGITRMRGASRSTG